MSGEKDILKMIKEDILRILVEKNGKATPENLREEVSSDESLEQPLKELERDGFIKTKKDMIGVTKTGREKGKNILEKRLLLETYFKKTKEKENISQIVHIIDLIEHYISMEVANNIRMLFSMKDKGVPLIKLKNGVITDIDLGIDLFERIVSMGIFPGERVNVASVLPNAVIIEIKNKKFALDKEIAEKIKGIAV